MNEDLILIMVDNEGVIGVAKENNDGCLAVYFSEGIEYQTQLETDEYTVLAVLSDVDESLFNFYD